MDSWEYYFLPVQIDNSRWSIDRGEHEPLIRGEVWSYIDNLGTKGWEMVSVVPVVSGQEKLTGYGLWFKRATGREQEPARLAPRGAAPRTALAAAS